MRNQDGIEKGISRLRLKLPTSISISAPIYSHRPYKRVCSYIGFSSHRSRLLLFIPFLPISPNTFPLPPFFFLSLSRTQFHLLSQQTTSLPPDLPPYPVASRFFSTPSHCRPVLPNGRRRRRRRRGNSRQMASQTTAHRGHACARSFYPSFAFTHTQRLETAFERVL